MHIKPDDKKDFLPIQVGSRIYEPKGNCDGFEVHGYTFRHGTKPGAWRRSHYPHGHKNDRLSYEFDWERAYRVSKCWKDQSRRRRQYRPVEM